MGGLMERRRRIMCKMRYVTRSLAVDKSGYLRLNVSPVSLTPATSSNFHYGLYRIRPGDRIIISGTTNSASAARLYAILDEQLNVLEVAPTYFVANSYEIHVPLEGYYLVVSEWTERYTTTVTLTTIE